MSRFIQCGVPLKPDESGEAPVLQTLKAHRTTILSNPTTNAFTDFDGLTVVTEESKGSSLSLNADGKTIDVLQAGMYQFGGCVHVQNNTVGLFSSVSVLTRIFKNGTTEAKCSQREFTVSFAANGARVLSFTGTDSLEVGDTVVLQYLTDESGVDFFSNALFDNAVACTLWLTRIGDN